MDKLIAFGKLVRAAERGVAFTGAGISTESGIPDYRGPQGVWNTETPVYYQDFMMSREARVRAWQRGVRMFHRCGAAKPNDGHLIITELQRRGHIATVITQNIDGLHLRAGNSPHRVIEVHGNLHQAICLACGLKGPMQAVLNRLRLGDADPSCEACGGILKSDTISFGQALVPAVIDRAMQSAQEADLLLAVGTSLKVFPVANAVTTAQAAGARIVIMNAQPTQFDEIADAVLNGSISAELPQVCGE